MKTTIVLKEFDNLSAGAVQIKHASAPASVDLQSQPATGSIDGFHEPPETRGDGFGTALHSRYTTPFVSAIPSHRWGINE